MTEKHWASRHNRVLGAPVRIPQPLEDGKARCAGCSAVVAVSPNGRLWRHRAPSGEDCAYVMAYRDVELTELPPVVIRTKGPATQPRSKGEPSRLDAGSHCVECGTWIPGERSLCGTCFATKRPSGGRR